MAQKETKQATWGGRFREPPSPLMAEFSESVSFDKALAPYDIAGSKAHARMLAEVGILTKAEFDAIAAGLDAILGEIRQGTFVWDEAFEDVHMNIEQVLTTRVPAAAKLHTARSRNDQVALDMRLYFRDACDTLSGEVKALMRVLVALAEKSRFIAIPGYTHLQRAQPVSAAHHLLAYVEMLSRDLARFEAVRKEANVCPLGSGAIAGTTLAIDRAFVARELGFVDENGEPLLTQNSMDAVADRDAFLDFAEACAVAGVHLSRMAEDMILWNSSEFGFIFLPDAYTTGSSMMPQKKNPDCMELIRGKSARLQGNLHTLLTLAKGLPLTYNRDLQEDKPPIFDCFRQTSLCLRVMAGALGHKDTHLVPEKCAAAVADHLLLATDLADHLVRSGVPFRRAHHVVGALVARAVDSGIQLGLLPEEEIAALTSAISSREEPFQHFSEADAAAVKKALEGDAWRKVFDLAKALSLREKPGMPGPHEVEKRLAHWKEQLK